MWVCVDMDSKRDIVAVLAVSLVNQTVAPVTIVTTNHVRILLVTHVPIGQAGMNGHNVLPHAVLVKDENRELAMEKTFQKVNNFKSLTPRYTGNISGRS